MKASVIITSRLNQFGAMALCVDGKPVAVAFGTARLYYRGQPRRRYELCIPREGLKHKDSGVVFWADEVDVKIWLRHFRREATK